MLTVIFVLTVAGPTLHLTRAGRPLLSASSGGSSGRLVSKARYRVGPPRLRVRTVFFLETTGGEFRVYRASIRLL